MHISSLFAHLNGLDYIFLLLVLFSFGGGLKRGLWGEVIAIASWIAAFAISILFANDLAICFDPYIKNPSVAVVVSFILLFCVTLILGQLVNWILDKLMAKTGFMFLNHLLGGAFGLIRGMLVVLFVAFVISNMGYNDREWFQKSQTVKGSQGALTWLQTRVVMPATVEQDTSDNNSDKEQMNQTPVKPAEEKPVAHTDIHSNSAHE